MEILLTTFGLLTLATLIILVGTGGHPLKAVSGFREFLNVLAANRRPLALTGLAVVLVLGFVYFFYVYPKAGLGPAQPIPFSHRLHAGHKAIDCTFCHPYVARSLFPGLPPVEKCLFCHNYIITGHPEIKKELAYYNSGTPTPWRKVFLLPEHVLFNHKRHIKKEIACESCHGDIRARDRLAGKRFKMGFCIQCHREKKAPLGCWIACHS
jgi:hypothetical protein